MTCRTFPCRSLRILPRARPAARSNLVRCAGFAKLRNIREYEGGSGLFLVHARGGGIDEPGELAGLRLDELDRQAFRIARAFENLGQSLRLARAGYQHDDLRGAVDERRGHRDAPALAGGRALGVVRDDAML